MAHSYPFEASESCANGNFLTGLGKRFVETNRTRGLTEINVSTIKVYESIEPAADTRGDEEMQQILRSVNNDRVSADARYRRTCFSNYTRQI